MPPKREIADGIAAASAMLAPELGVTPSQAKALLSKLKKEGCKGFDHSRVDLAIVRPALREYLKRQTEKSADITRDKYALECERLLKQLREMDLEYDVKRGLYELRTDVLARDEARLHAVRGVLITKLRAELPPRLEGKTAVEIAAAMDGIVADVLAALSGADIKP